MQRSLATLSIALRSLGAIALLHTLGSPAVAADQTESQLSGKVPVSAFKTRKSMPNFGNTPESDRYLMRETADHAVFNPGEDTTQLQSYAEQTSGDQYQQRSPATIWEFVQSSRRLQIPEHDSVEFFRQQYRREAFWVSRILHRATPFAGHIVQALDTRDLPVELVLLPAIESGYRPDVHSSQNAAGLWQLIPSTATEIGVVHNTWFDGRADIIHSTRAAMQYLSYLNAEFNGDWLLTLAAYNAGPGRVRNAMNGNAELGLPVDFWSLKLPTETQNYVPKFFALLSIMRDERIPELDIPLIRRGPGFDIVNVGRRITLEQVAGLTDLPIDELKRLNSALKQYVTPPSGPHIIYLPRGSGNPFVSQLRADFPDEVLTSVNSHNVVAGDNLTRLSRKYGISLDRLMQINSLDSTDIRIGQRLLVTDSSYDSGDNWHYIVTVGDTLSDIAARFSVSIADIRAENGSALTSDIIQPGERLSLIRTENHRLLR